MEDTIPLSKMKDKLSVTVDIELVEKLRNIVNTGKFRNKSHLVEYALNKLIEELES